MTSPVPDHVVLLDADGRPSGTADRMAVHTTDTPLHLAFSCYLVDDDGRTLMTRRALSKRTWPGVWTNSCCGHPLPDEPLEQAVARRVHEELGVHVNAIRPLIPDFRYQAVDASGIRENEVCPVFVATFDGELAPHPDEVMESRWVDPQDLVEVAARAPWSLSPWCVAQLERVEASELWPGAPARA